MIRTELDLQPIMPFTRTTAARHHHAPASACSISPVR